MSSASIFPSANYGGHSARVDLRLLVGGQPLRVTQMGPDFILLAAPTNHPPTDASLLMQVDGRERCWNVHLPHGISASTKRVAIVARA